MRIEPFIDVRLIDRVNGVSLCATGANYADFYSVSFRQSA